MTVKELMTTNVCFVKSDATLSDVISLMQRYDVGLVPVCDNKGRLLGLITDRDVVLRGIDGFANLTAAEVMTSEPSFVTPTMDIHDAALVFAKKRVRRLPVLENSRLVGILSLSDLAKKRVFLAEVGDIFGAIAKE